MTGIASAIGVYDPYFSQSSSSSSSLSISSSQSTSNCSYAGANGSCYSQASSNNASQAQSNSVFVDAYITSISSSQTYADSGSNVTNWSNWGQNYGNSSYSGTSYANQITFFNGLFAAGSLLQIWNGDYGYNMFSEFGGYNDYTVTDTAITSSGGFSQHDLATNFSDYFQSTYDSGVLTGTLSSNYSNTTESYSSGNYFNQYPLNNIPSVGGGSAVPEPGTMLTMMSGGLMLFFARRRRTA